MKLIITYRFMIFSFAIDVINMLSGCQVRICKKRCKKNLAHTEDIFTSRYPFEKQEQEINIGFTFIFWKSFVLSLFQSAYEGKDKIL